MHILMQARSNLFTSPGGDTTQVKKTAEALEKLGVNVDINVKDRSETLYKKYDLVHLFNTTLATESFLSLQACRKLGLPAVISTIYNPPRDVWCFEQFNDFGLSGKVTKLMSHINLSWKAKEIHHLIKNGSISELIKTLFLPYKSMVQGLMEGADMLLPNSNMEKMEIISDFHIEEERFRIVPNAVDVLEPVHDIKKMIIEYPWLSDYDRWIIVPGRIEPFKNQLAVIDALDSVNVGVMFAGATSTTHKKYIKTFMDSISTKSKFHYLGLLDQGLLKSFFAIVDVVLLPSWSETTGLVGMEGAVNNCQLVLTSRGYTKEYYEDYSYYCSPDNNESISGAVVQALESPKDISPLINKIKESFTWECAARETLRAYKTVLSGIKSSQ